MFWVSKGDHFLLHPVQIWVICPNHPQTVAHSDVLEAIGQQKAGDGDACRTSAIDNDLALPLILAHHLQGIDDAGQNHNSRPMLVIVEDWDGKRFLQPLFNLKAARRRNIF